MHPAKEFHNFLYTRGAHSKIDPPRGRTVAGAPDLAPETGWLVVAPPFDTQRHPRWALRCAPPPLASGCLKIAMSPWLLILAVHCAVALMFVAADCNKARANCR
jgi:hypothetical protein